MPQMIVVVASISTALKSHSNYMHLKSAKSNSSSISGAHLHAVASVQAIAAMPIILQVAIILIPCSSNCVLSIQ